MLLAFLSLCLSEESDVFPSEKEDGKKWLVLFIFPFDLMIFTFIEESLERRNCKDVICDIAEQESGARDGESSKSERAAAAAIETVHSASHIPFPFPNPIEIHRTSQTISENHIYHRVQILILIRFLLSAKVHALASFPPSFPGPMLPGKRNLEAPRTFFCEEFGDADSSIGVRQLGCESRLVWLGCFWTGWG